MSPQVQEKSKNPQTSQAEVDFYARDKEHRNINTPAFTEGEKVRLKGTFYLTSDGEVGVDPVYDGGLTPRTRTQFILGNIDDKPELKELIGKPAEITVKLEEYRGIAHFHKFSAELVTTPSPVVLADYSPQTLQANASRYTGIEGTVVKITARQGNQNGELVLRQNDGKELTIQYFSSKTTLGSSVLESAKGQAPQPGDRVNLTAFIHPDGTLRSSGTLHLAQPSAERVSSDLTRRNEIQVRTEEIEKQLQAKNFSAARELIGEVALREPTRAERGRLFELIKQFPVEERPIYSEEVIDQKVAEDLTKAYGENVYAKTQAELIDYASRLGRLEVRPVKGVDLAYSYRLLEAAGVKVEDQEKIYANAIAVLKPQVVGVDDRNIEFDQKYMLERALTYLGSTGTQSAADRLVSLLDQQVKDNQFRPINAKPGDPQNGSIVFELSGALNALTANPNGLANLDRHLPTLVRAEAVLAQRGDEVFTCRQLGTIIDDIVRRRSAPMALNELKLPPYRPS